MNSSARRRAGMSPEPVTVRGVLAGVYVRISKDRTGDAVGVRRQESDCREWCERQGWTVAEVYRDNDLSASRFASRPRPEFERLLADAATGRIGAIVWWKTDRGTRRGLREVGRALEAADAGGGCIISVAEGIDSRTAAGELMLGITAAIGKAETDAMSERLRRMHRQIAEEGRRAGGGTRPFGYAADRVTVLPDEAAFVREAAERVLNGEALRAICRDWTQRGVPTVMGGSWKPAVLKRILTSPSTAGLRSHRGVDRPAVWPGLLDEVTLRRVANILTDPARRSTGTARSYLLTGLLRCGLCGERMVARPKPSTRPGNPNRANYACVKAPDFTGCGHMACLAGPLEAEVAQRLFAVVDNAHVAAADQPGPGADRSSEIVSLEERLEQLARDHYVDRLIGRQQFLAASNALEASLDSVRRAWAAEQVSAVAKQYVGGGLSAAWPDLTFAQRRVVLFGWVESVVLRSAVRGRNRFDPDRLTVTWRA